MSRYWEVPVVLCFKTPGEEPFNSSQLSHDFQMSGIQHLAQFIKGTVKETPEAEWTIMFKSMEQMR